MKFLHAVNENTGLRGKLTVHEGFMSTTKSLHQVNQITFSRRASDIQAADDHYRLVVQ